MAIILTGTALDFFLNQKKRKESGCDGERHQILKYINMTAGVRVQKRQYINPNTDGYDSIK